MTKVSHVVAGVAWCVALASSGGGDAALRAALAAPIDAQSAQMRVRLSPESPLAVNSTWVFVVAENGVTLLRQSLSDEGPWRPLPPIPGVLRVTGLAATDESLFVADGRQHRILSVDLATGESRIYATLPAAVEPADLAFTTSLFFADARGPDIHQWSNGGVRVISPEATSRSSSPRNLASDGKLLLVSSPDDGTVWQGIAGWGTMREKFAAVQRPSTDGPGPELKNTLGVVVAGDVSFPLRPVAIASRRGVVYVVDGNSRSLFAYSSYWPRPVRLHFGPRPLEDPARLAASVSQLLVLDRARGTVERWPRLVPTRVSCSLTGFPEKRLGAQPPCVQSQSAAFARFFEYLNTEQYLPTKRLSRRTDAPDSINQEYTTATMRQAMTRIACALDKNACSGAGEGVLLGPARAGILVPDVYGESYVDVAQVSLAGATTLGMVADAAVPSPQFSDYVSERGLARLNASVKAGSDTRFRDLRAGAASVPVELVRFVVGIPEESLRTMSARFPELTFVPLGEASAKRAGTVIAVQPTDVEQVKAANTRALESIGGPFELALPSYPSVGVAEHDVDLANPDIAEAFSGAMGPVRAAATGTPATPGGITIRDFRDDDHGTAVASLIAARPSAFSAPALGAGLQLLTISDAEPTIGESIRDAYVNHLVRIFNLSFHFGKSNVPRSLKEAVEQYTQALFVVAAGNDTVTGPDGNVCAAFEAYPVCWGDRQNVLVVTATTLDGSNLVAPDVGVSPPVPGANWNPNIVHVAAPGEGLYASGRGNCYVQVRGSSFATPLVTATAALLYAQAVRTPWEIKQRILATADRVAGLTHRVGYGRLNARRATTNLSFAVTIDELKRETAIALNEAGRLITFSTPTADFTVRLSNIRRLTRAGSGKYDLLYLDGEQLRRVQVNQSAWRFKYFELNERRQPKGRVKEGDLSDFVDYIGPIL